MVEHFPNSSSPEEGKSANLSDLFGYTEKYKNVDGQFLPFYFELIENSDISSNTSAINHNKNNHQNLIISNRVQLPKKNRRKYDPDCLRKKIKQLILKYSLEFINKKIKTIFNKKNEIKKIGNNQTKNTNIIFEQNFMYKTLADIFSTRISKKYNTNKYPEMYNKNKIKKLISKNEDLKRIFNIKFIECLNHFFGNTSLEELNGMKTIQNIYIKEEKYKRCLIYYATLYEENVLRAKARPRNRRRNK